MNRRRIKAVWAKEWLDVKRNKMILVSMSLLPLVMVAVVVISALAIFSMNPEDLASQGFDAPAGLTHLTALEAIAVIVNDQNLFYLVMTPMLLPVVISAQSIIGEKEAKSLEPVLATPITTRELLTGKALAAVTPALVLGWIQVVLALVAIAIVTTPSVLTQAVRPMWLVGYVVAMPLVSLMSTQLALIVSTRMKDARAAQAVAGLAVLPVLGIGMAVLVGQLYLTVDTMLIACGVMVLVNIALSQLAVRLFQRERILARIG